MKLTPRGPERGARGLAVGLLLLGVGCSGQMTAGDAGGLLCPSDLPPSCPPAVPSYQSDIAPLVQRKCLGCHSVSGVEANRPLDGYANLYTERGAVLHQVYGCLMPPSVVPQLDPTERQLLLTWLVCASPNN